MAGLLQEFQFVPELVEAVETVGGELASRQRGLNGAAALRFMLAGGELASKGDLHDVRKSVLQAFAGHPEVKLPHAGRVNHQPAVGQHDQLAPGGVDIYYDNVGGPILNAMLLTMKSQGRIVCCGMIADYNRSGDPNPITNLWEVVARQLTLQGFLLFTYHDKVPAALDQLAQWIDEGKIKVKEHITTGIANTPKAFCELMSGTTTGKALVALDLPEEN